MTKGSRNGRVLHVPIWSWHIKREDIYASLGFRSKDRKIPAQWSCQGKYQVPVGFKALIVHPFEMRVREAQGHRQHRIHVRCPKCHSWIPFGRLHQHILSRRCLATAFQLPQVPSLTPKGWDHV